MMTTATLQKEIQQLKERQKRLERTLSFIIARHRKEEKDVRPEYLRRVRRILKNMQAGKGIVVVHSQKELKRFFANH